MEAMRLATLTKERNNLATELDVRKNSVFVRDPVFTNIIYLLQDFQIYRGAQQGKPCVIYVTAMPDSLALASTVAQFSNSVFGCFTFGPDVAGNPDLDEMAADGMMPGVVLIHIQRDDRAALALQERIGNQIQTRLSYAPPKMPKNRLYAPSQYNYNESFVWLQFGSRVKWNSELFARQREQ